MSQSEQLRRAAQRLAALLVTSTGVNLSNLELELETRKPELTTTGPGLYLKYIDVSMEKCRNLIRQ